MTPIDARTSRTLFTALLFALAIGFLYYVRHTLIAFLFAIFFAYLMEPAVSRLQQVVRGRGRAIAILYLVLVLLLGWLTFYAGPRILQQSERLGSALPSLLEARSLEQIAQQIGQQRGWSTHTRDTLTHFLTNHRSEIVELAQSAGLRLAEVAQRAWLLILVPILSIFFLRDGRIFSEVLLNLVRTAPQRELVRGVIDDLNEMLAHFIRAQLTLAAFSMIVYSSFLGLAGVPFALMLGTAGGVLEFIPVVGPLVAAALILGVAFLLGYQGWITLILFLLAWRVFQDYLISPKIMGSRMELHPLAAIFGVLAGGELAGVLGVYLSIPIMASLRIVWHRWRLYSEKRTFGPLNDYALGSGFTPRER